MKHESVNLFFLFIILLNGLLIVFMKFMFITIFFLFGYRDAGILGNPTFWFSIYIGLPNLIILAIPNIRFPVKIALYLFVLLLWFMGIVLLP